MEHFGTLPDGRETRLLTLSHPSGMVAKISDFGATLVSLAVPDRDGRVADVTHGFDSVDGYASADNPHFGATIGRFGNRIAHGRFTLDGVEYALATNNEPAGIPCHLHGGVSGFNRRLWTVIRHSERSVVLGYLSQDGEEGYPGNLAVTVTYALTDDHELIWEATATTDAPTILNLVHHSYWNLSGDPARTIHDHILTLEADRYLPTGPGLIPTGEIAPVAGTPMDFTRPTRIGERIEEPFDALRFGGGYDHCWVINRAGRSGLSLAATLEEPRSGRIMRVFSNQPGIQCYAGNFLDGSAIGKNGVAYGRRTALCLETENFPDAPNRSHFPPAVLRPGENYLHRMVHRFSA